MKHVLMIVGMLAIFFGSCSQRRDEVVVVLATKSYHTEDCARVQMARTIVETRSEARHDGYKPCPLCNPDSTHGNP